MIIARIERARRVGFKRPNQCRWITVAANGRKLAQSTETYTNVSDCLDALLLHIGPIKPLPGDAGDHALEMRHKGRAIGGAYHAFGDKDVLAVVVIDTIRAGG